MKETVGRLETTIDDLKKIVVAVTAASKSTDNAVTAITNAILDSQKVVITNKLVKSLLDSCRTSMKIFTARG